MMRKESSRKSFLLLCYTQFALSYAGSLALSTSQMRYLALSNEASTNINIE